MNRTSYLPTINLGLPGMMTALYEGALTLQPGQWIQCNDGTKSRFLGANRHVIYALHYPYATNVSRIREMRSFVGAR